MQASYVSEKLWSRRLDVTQKSYGKEIWRIRQNVDFFRNSGVRH